MNKFLLKMAQHQIKEKVIDPIPPEKDVAMTLYLYGCTEQEFTEMRDHLNISDPIFVKIQNHLRDRWREN